MGRGFTRELRAILLDNDCWFVRQGKGDHEIWQSPISGARFVVDGNIPSRHLANAVLKQAGIKRKFD